MKRYIPILETKEIDKTAIAQINELAKIISFSGLKNPKDIDSSPELQSTIQKLKELIIAFYSEDVVIPEIAEQYIYISVNGDNTDGVSTQEDEDGKRSVSLYNFEIEEILIADKDNEDTFIDMTSVWGEIIEDEVLNIWGDRWGEYYSIKSTQDSLRNWSRM